MSRPLLLRRQNSVGAAVQSVHFYGRYPWMAPGLLDWPCSLKEGLSTSRHPVDMRAFWLRRFKAVHGIGAVANLSFSKERNERDYARCQAFMARQLREDCGGQAPESLLDLGYGQGHYAHVAHEIGVRRYVGLDFAAPPLTMPGDYHFLEQDICEEGFDLGEKFEVVLLLDVAFHVIDDLAFERLLANISQHARW